MASDDAGAVERAPRPLWRALLKLARPHQWAKSGFVFIGPMYGLQDTPRDIVEVIGLAFLTAVSFALASSGLYVINDLLDVEADRAHPRKRFRPIAAGEVSVGLARGYASVLLLAAAGVVWFLPEQGRALVGLLLGLHVANVFVYSTTLKHIVIVDVISLAMGFVIRVLAGCAVLTMSPSTWLLNVTFFLSMFLAFGKRLGERRTMGSQENASKARGVQSAYSDNLLNMVVVVTGVATLLTYSGYVQTREDAYTYGFNLLWLSILPATYCLIRCILLVERGDYDDPTELAVRDLPFQLSAGVFVIGTGVLVVWPQLTGV